MDNMTTDGETQSPGDSQEVRDPESFDGNPVTPEEIDALKARAAKAEEHWASILRISADFENFKKRAARERQEAQKFAAEGLLERLVPVLDNFEMATLAANQPGASVDSLKTGVAMIQQQLKSVLSDAGMTEINALGLPFDPNLHEAVSQQPSADVPEGQVLQQLRKGYKLRDRLLRPATVVVAQAPASE